MINDPVVERLHKQRGEYMERFHYDFGAIVRDIRGREAAHSTLLLEPPAAAPPDTAMPRTRFARR